MEHYDVIVVGGGPAGSSVASRLRIDGPIKNVLLIECREKDDFGRYHEMCGEGVSLKCLTEAHVDSSELIKNYISGAVERWPGGITLSANMDGAVIDRSKLIAALRAPFLAMGGEARTGRVHSVRRSGKGYIVSCGEEDIHCDYLVGADGAHSVVRRDLFEIEPPVYMNVVQYVVDRSMENRFFFFFDERYKGKYRWEFPSGNHTKVGFPLGPDPPPCEVLQKQNRTIPIGPLERIVKGRACLVWDAASQANPVTFGGIMNGLTAGRMAAEAIMNENLELYQNNWPQSPLADPCFYETYQLMRAMPNDMMRGLVEPFRYGPNMTAIMRELMNNQGFRPFYRSHVRKLEHGW
ncbi:NAD(P)/FAD-dependent oxidoreductase [Methanomassiliicoccus luminyensis]|uniref:NAD(P)/FAD-dependent oxidoreductase n=1 Tax=Methanomassiliicoccus luminyensis TaxID=1080712 RepID=UPI00037BC83F|nr:NAD(P)/FAD-dependent oxidoreductase [Methanomassiliicoccus luminyensis]